MAQPKTSNRRTQARKADAQRLSAVIRVSRRNGRSGDSFMSPDQQREAITATGANVVSWHDETDSVSGKTTNRPGLRAAIDEALNGTTDGIIVAKVDRFSRSLVEGLQAVRELHEAGKVFVAVKDGIDGRNPKNIGAKVTLTMMLLFAEWQLESLTDSWDDVRHRHIDAGIANSWPFGYMRGEDRRLIPDPDTAPRVVEIFTRRAAGASWHGIADELTEAGVLTPTAERYRRWKESGSNDGAPPKGGSRWTHNQVGNIVGNRCYLGELRSGDLSNTEAHEPLVSLDLWQRANGVMKTPAKRDRESFVLSGLVRCASCGSRMGGTTERYTPERNGVKKPYFIRYYRCRSRFSWGVCSGPARVRADEVEALVFERFDRDYLTSASTWTATASSAEMDEAIAGLRSAEAELDAFMSASSTTVLRQRFGDAKVDEMVLQRIEAIDAAQAHVMAVQNETLGAQLPTDLVSLWPNMGDEDKRTVLSMVYPVVAVRLSTRPEGTSTRGWSEPAVNRTRIFGTNENPPDDLPGRDGGAHLRPIKI